MTALPSAGDLELAIHEAMRAHDMPAAVALLRLLAVQDPRRAALLLNILQVGLELSRTEPTQ